MIVFALIGGLQQRSGDGGGDGLGGSSRIVFEINDDGPGIAEDVQAKIFDPFFTTKFTGRGLGLAAVAVIVRAQKGAIEVTTEQNVGTTFRILLPAMTSGAGC